MSLILSLFPGIGLLDIAFEEEGFCVVRGPDLLWGGDVKRFYPPAGRFDGVIGGDPCQAHTRLRHIILANGYELAEDLTPEFERCLDEARPAWFLRENVIDAPRLRPREHYAMSEALIRDVWCGGETMRLRRFQFGALNGARLDVETLALHRPDPEPAVTGGGRAVPVAIGGGGQRKRPSSRHGRLPKEGTIRPIADSLVAQGLPPDFFGDKHPFTKAGLSQMIGNGVPLAMGRAVAKAVVKAMSGVNVK